MRNVAYLKIVMAAAVWGSVGLFVRAIPIPSPVIVFFRVFLAGLFLAASFLARRRLDLFDPRGQLPLLVVAGLLMAANWLLFFFSFTLTSVASAVLATYAAPVFIAVLAALLLKERLEKVTVFALAVAMTGIALMVLSGGDEKDVSGLGVLIALASGFFYALVVVCNKHLVAKMPAESIMFFVFIVATVPTAPFLVVAQPFSVDQRSAVLLLILGGFHTALAISLSTAALRQVKAQVAGVLSYVEPVSAAVLAALILGEMPTLGVYLGGTLVIAAGMATMLGAASAIEAKA